MIAWEIIRGPVGEIQRNVLLFLCRRKAKDALWFGETYGLMPESLRLRDKNGKSHDINLREIPALPQEPLLFPCERRYAGSHLRLTIAHERGMM